MKNNGLVFAVVGAAVLGALFWFGQSNDSNTDAGYRTPSGADVNVEYPAGHDYQAKEELWHLSEGADVIPLRWFLNIKSIYNSKGVPEGSYLFKHLDKKFGVVELDNIYHKGSKGYGKGWTSPMKWVGLTLAWSQPISDFSNYRQFPIDASKKPKNDFAAGELLATYDALGVRKVENSSFPGDIEIPMVGTNCAFCHSNLTKFNGAKGVTDSFVEGAPNMLNVRGFFQDFVKSTIATMLDVGDMMEFMKRLEDKNLAEFHNPRKDAKAFVKEFKSALGMISLGDGKVDFPALWSTIKHVKISSKGIKLDKKPT